MKNATKTTLLTFATLIMAASCKKENNDQGNTPIPTTAAPGYTICNVNGGGWTSEKTGNYIKAAKSILGIDTFPGCEVRMSGDTMLFAATRFTDTSLILARIVLNKDRKGEYSGTTSLSGLVGMFYLTEPDENLIIQNIFTYNTNYSFTINKWDAANKKVSGTFNFNMVHNFGGPGFNITKGSFEEVNFVTN